MMTRAAAVMGLLAGLFCFSAAGQDVSFGPGVSFTGAPSYVSEYATKFRDNGGPLSPFGSHVGLKAEVRQPGFAGVEHYACATGRIVYDYARTGRAATSTVSFFRNGAPVGEPRSRQIRFEYYGWEETADFGSFQARARVHFLGLDRYVISITVFDAPPELTPVVTFVRNGRDFRLEKPSRPDEILFRFAVQPIVIPGKNFLAVRPSAPVEIIPAGDRKSFDLRLAPLAAASGTDGFSLVFGYAPDDAEPARAAARTGQDEFGGPEAAWQKMIGDRDRFFASLPPPHLGAGQDQYLELYRMAATALDNGLYAPRGAMQHWACVPTKIHYNWFWLWDSGFQALGYAEFKPDMARDVILTLFQAQRPDGFIAHMADEREKPLTPHSQAPVFGWAGERIISRFSDDPDFQSFQAEVYDQSKSYLKWWKKKRDVNRNGLYEYLSQDEGGWDNSPRMYYVPNIMFISYYGSLGELIGAKIKPLDNVDLNAWMYSYFRAMERWARRMGKQDEAEQWKAQALELAARVDEGLWDPDRECWLDTYAWLGSKKTEHFQVLTPHIWFPAFTGATRDRAKARAVIEKHLLNPDEFFGKYPIPIVAYNDPTFDNTTPGWTASIWLVTAYSALEALWRFGYEDEAAELRQRILAMMADQKGMKAIFETYDPETGLYKNDFSTGGYNSSQFGWSSTFTMMMVLERYQEERFVFDDTMKVQGHIRRAEDFDSRDDFYWIECGRDVPRVELSSGDGLPLIQAKSFKIRLDDPYGAGPGPYRVWIRGLAFDLSPGREQEVGLK